MDIRGSLDRINNSDVVLGEMFYEKFFSRYPEAKRWFRDVDLTRQSLLLTMQLSIIEAYYRYRRPPAGHYLQVLGTRHSDKNVPREFYPKFRDVLLETLEEFHGSDWDEMTASQWREAIDLAVEKMFEGYEARYHV